MILPSPQQPISTISYIKIQMPEFDKRINVALNSQPRVSNYQRFDKFKINIWNRIAESDGLT